MLQYTIFCILANSKSPFPIKINKDEIVGELKRAIKKENRKQLRNYDITQIILYHVDAKSPQEAKIKSQTLSSLKRLQPIDELSEVFGIKGPRKKVIHILVWPTAGELIQWIRGSGPSLRPAPFPCSHPCSADSIYSHAGRGCKERCQQIWDRLTKHIRNISQG